MVALTWGAEDLADAIGASENRAEGGEYGFTYELARSLCLLGAAAAGVAAIETIQGDFRDEDRLRRRAMQVRRAGYRGMLAIHPAQVEIINAAFTPTAEERGRGGGGGGGAGGSSICSPPIRASGPSATRARCWTAPTSPAPSRLLALAARR